jgi:hypothetical protein
VELLEACYIYWWLQGLCEGLLTLGVVSAIHEHELLVSLPGRTVGSVPITAVSAPYTEFLKGLEAAGTLASPKGKDVVVDDSDVVSARRKGQRFSMDLDY